MKRKRTIYLIFMFSILTLHTLLLTNWLSKEDDARPQKHQLNSLIPSNRSNLHIPISKANVDSVKQKKILFEGQ